NRCGASRDTADNFCRVCGHQFTVNLPSVPPSRLPVQSSGPGLPASLVGSLALLAVGTGLESLPRRRAGTAARRAGRAAGPALPTPEERPQPPARRTNETSSVTIDEVIYVRKVEVRR